MRPRMFHKMLLKERSNCGGWDHFDCENCGLIMNVDSTGYGFSTEYIQPRGREPCRHFRGNFVFAAILVGGALAGAVAAYLSAGRG